MKPQILVGCDPEVFVKQNDKFVSAHGLILGNKANPHPVDKGAVQVDGMALEFNIDPANSREQFVGNIQTVFAVLKSMCPEYEIVAVPVADFGLDYINSQPAEARELGCDPDYDAVTGAANEKPNMNLPFRTASGHVHIGWGSDFSVDDVDHDDRCRLVARQMDFFLGLPSLFYDDDQRRREMYGNPGCYRRKVYGVEYRTLSNAWLKSEALMAWVYDSVQKGMHRLFDGEYLVEQFGDISKIIKTSDKKAAEKIITKANLEVCYG
ncbi:MAG: hypothetical protein [Podoviridae sp. ctbj_2]|nr:MAG: hypothetical protein [Podoviridae sp. ctbj_2]